MIDKGVHASIYDGLNLAAVKFNRYKHNDINDLVNQIRLCSINLALITEGIFSMSGQVPHLYRLLLHYVMKLGQH